MRVDLHMHTGYSADAQYPQSIDDKIHACEQAGLDIIGITDHLDFLRSGGTRDNRDPEACACEVWEKRRPAGNGGIEVLAGIEIGQLHATPGCGRFCPHASVRYGRRLAACHAERSGYLLS